MVELDLSTATPAEIDAAWLEARQPADRLRAKRNDLLAQATKYRKHGGRYAEDADKFVAQANALGAKIEEALIPTRPFQAEWDRRGGWTRAYLVPDGHIHKTTACQSLYPTTLISWLPEQSGWDEEQIVEAAGMMACTFCYPSAPVEALRAAHEAAKKEGQCAGSGEYAQNLKSWSQRFVACHVCGTNTSVTSRGNLRAHKAKAAA